MSDFQLLPLTPARVTAARRSLLPLTLADVFIPNNLILQSVNKTHNLTPSHCVWLIHQSSLSGHDVQALQEASNPYGV